MSLLFLMMEAEVELRSRTGLTEVSGQAESDWENARDGMLMAELGILNLFLAR